MWKRTRLRLAALIAGTAMLMSVASCLAANTHQKLALAGEIDPFGEEFGSNLQCFGISRDGLVFYYPTGFFGGTATVYFGKANATQGGVGSGSRLPGGLTLSRFNQADINPAGQMAFTASTSRGNNLYVLDAGSLRLVAQSGMAAAGDGNFENSGFSGTPSIGASGNVAFFARTTGSGQGIFLALVNGAGYRLIQIAKLGTPSGDGGAFTSFGDTVAVTLPPGGSPSVLFRARTSGTAETALFLGSASDVKLIVTGFPSTYAMNNRGEVTYTNNGLFLGGRTGSHQVLANDDAAPNGGSYVNFGSPTINDAGTVAFSSFTYYSATNRYGTELYLRSTQGEIERIAYEGQEFDGGVLVGFSDPQINNNGAVLFRAGLKKGDNSVAGLFIAAEGKISKVLAEADRFLDSIVAGGGFFSSGGPEISDAGILPGHGSFNDANQVSYKVRLANGKSGIFLYTPPPAPPVITSETSARGVLGQSFSYRIVGTNVPTTFSASSLPPGLRVNAASGVITGIPQTSGDFVVSLRAANDGGEDIKTLTIRVTDLSAYRGAYRGDLESVLPGNATAGLVAFSLTGGAGFTGVLQMGGARYTVRGAFDESGAFAGSVPRSRFQVAMHFATNAASGQITGTVSRDGNVLANFTTDRLPANFSARNPSPFTGYYTVALPADPAHPEASYPQGAGYALLTVTPAGGVRFAGALSDGVAISQGSFLSQSGEFVLYQPIYGVRGSISGQLTVHEAAADNHVSGSLRWFQPSQSGAIEVVGSRYVAPPARPVVLELADGRLNATFSGSDVSINPPTKKVAMVANNVFRVVGVEPFKLNVALPTGVFTGTVRDIAGKEHGFRGVVLQKQNLGKGFFKGSRQFGRVELAPAP